MRGWPSIWNFVRLTVTGYDGIQLIGEATQWDDMRAPASSAGASASNPTYAQFRNNGAGSIGVYAYRFDNPGAEKDLFFDLQAPHGMMTGSMLSPHLHWSPDTSGGGNVGLGLEYSEANIDETFPATTLTVPIAVPAAGVAYHHQLAEFGDIAKPSRSFSCMFKCRVYRTATGDTYGGAIWAHEFDLHFEIDTFGTREEFIK